ncbi:hypothetical protein [Yinghuangia seranimata]|uniref:SCO2583/SCO2584 N-terminal domain-containing protein n=1 Tax=Yinghuangia seranimata TaxID=408067 RepID=UPI00248B9CED|nr:hypothetical protein [Yinghuangia seranimata]MDI2127407.1 hypothetical protein [Yinghuangia seranimata]
MSERESGGGGPRRPAGDGSEPNVTGDQTPSADDPFEGLVLDEDFIKGAGKSEGSARARMLAARWRETPPENTGFREAADSSNVTRMPRRRRTFFKRRRDPWGRPVRRDRTNLKIAVWFVLLALILLVGTNQGYFRDLLGGNSDDAAGYSSDPMTAQPSVSGVASAAAPLPSDLKPIDPDVPTRDHPFAGSPAINYADGAAGLALPEAKPVAGYTAAEVRTALERSQRMVELANLDPATLRGEFPTGLVDLIDPADPLVAAFRKAFTTPSRDDNALNWVTRFDPKEIELVGPVVKVSGIMSYKLDDDGVLTVDADYSFVYPVAKPGSTEVTRALVRRTLTTKLFKRGKYRATKDGTLWLHLTDRDLTNSDCARYGDGFMHPTFASDPGTPATGPTTDPYDRTKPLDTQPPGGPQPSPGATGPDPDACGTASRI